MDHLHLIHPLRMYNRMRRNSDYHVFAPRTRFIPDPVLERFQRRTHGRVMQIDEHIAPLAGVHVDVAAKAQAIWE